MVRTMFAIAILLGVTAVTAHPAARAQQVPAPCTVPLGAAAGGETIRISTLQLTLPAGYSYQYGIYVETGASHIRVCVVELGAEVTLNLQTGEETRRTGSGAASAVLNQIVDSATLVAPPGAPTFTPTPLPTSTPLPSPTPQPPPTAVPQASGSSGGGGGSLIRPPNTGSGGLPR